jgi:voltage-gated potassium channel
MMAEMLASPLADVDPYFGGMLALIILIVMLVAAFYMANKKIVWRVVLPFAGVWLVARAIEALSDSHHIYAHLAPVAGLALSCALLWAIFDRFNSMPQITRSVIAEAFICYLILAIAFFQLYWILNQLLDHAFNQEIPVSQTSTLLYFSMITLSTVGYGIIAPINPYVRLVAAFESMIGIFYVAVVVARLVSSYRPERQRGTDETGQ